MEVDMADSVLDSPIATSRAINMMDLDPNIMDEPYDSGFLQSSAPIPIRLNNHLSSIYKALHFMRYRDFFVKLKSAFALRGEVTVKCNYKILVVETMP
jgi:hypothetical protein